MKAAKVKPVRCAIYTRVSTDQGLDQEFNSLDAQYDASAAYIKSQAHAGWSSDKSCCPMALRERRSDRSGRNGGSVWSAPSREADAGSTRLSRDSSLTLSRLHCASDAASVMST
jgi:hypothetical protein